jgi:endonuclease/exonuclease/phosphatase family metal-dependent hydrolase
MLNASPSSSHAVEESSATGRASFPDVIDLADSGDEGDVEVSNANKDAAGELLMRFPGACPETIKSSLAAGLLSSEVAAGLEIDFALAAETPTRASSTSTSAFAAAAGPGSGKIDLKALHLENRQRKKLKTTSAAALKTTPLTDSEWASATSAPPLPPLQNTRGTCVAASAPLLPEDEGKFSCITYNIWFVDVQGDFFATRMRGVASEIRRKEPDLVGLQEVIPATLGLLKGHLGDTYNFFPLQGMEGYFCVLAVHKRRSTRRGGFTAYANTGPLFRGLCHVEIEIAKDTWVRAGCTHLQSFLGPGMDGSAERPAQLEEAKEALASSSCAAAILMGDMNWAKKDIGMPLGNWLDAWTASRPGEDGFTYDARTNGMLLGSMRERFDRCLASGQLAVESVELIGTEALRDPNGNEASHKKKRRTRKGVEFFDNLPVLPSDHFGLFVKFALI